MAERIKPASMARGYSSGQLTDTFIQEPETFDSRLIMAKIRSVYQ